MIILTCKDCGERKIETDFYAHPAMANGRLGSCKECVKARVRQHRIDNLDRIQAYDRDRGQLEHRKKANVIRGRRYKRESKKWREANPEKWAAHIKVNNALKRGELTKPNCCEACKRVRPLEGHHDDYSKPLHVRWLCRQCHGAHHRALNEAARNAAQLAAE